MTRVWTIKVVDHKDDSNGSEFRGRGQTVSDAIQRFLAANKREEWEWTEREIVSVEEDGPEYRYDF